VSDLKDEKLIKSKPTRKLKRENSILEYFEYFCGFNIKDDCHVWTPVIIQLN